MGSIFESTQSGMEIVLYVEVYNDLWSVFMCIFVYYDSFVSYNIFWHIWKDIPKMSMNMYNFIMACWAFLCAVV